MFKKYLGKLGLLLGGLCVGLFLVELIARFPALPSDSDLLFNSPDTSPVGLYVLDTQTRVVPAPNFQADVSSLGFSASLRTNALGVRGPQPESVTQEQWLALGDSFTMSVQVSEEESFAGRLGAAKNVHIWNAGVDGYSTWQSKIRYEQLAPKLPIKHVLLTFFTGNDFQDNDLFPILQKQRLPGKAGTPIPRNTLPGWKLFLLRHSYLYAHYRVYEQRQQVQNAPQARNWKQELSLFHRSGQQRLQHLSQNTEKALRALQKSTQRRGAKLTVAIAPPAFVIDQSRASATFELVGLDPSQALLNAPQKKVAEILKRNNIRTCDLSTNLNTAPTESYFKTDGHWTPKGHDLVSQSLTSCIP